MLHDDAGAAGGGVGDQPVRAHRLFGEPAEETRRHKAASPRASLPALPFSSVMRWAKWIEPRGHQLPRAAQHLGAFARLLRAAQSAMARSAASRAGIGMGDIGRGDRGENGFGRRVDDVEALGGSCAMRRRYRRSV